VLAKMPIPCEALIFLVDMRHSWFGHPFLGA
jgi:hypothetical protein